MKKLILWVLVPFFIFINSCYKNPKENTNLQTIDYDSLIELIEPEILFYYPTPVHLYNINNSIYEFCGIQSLLDPNLIYKDPNILVSPDFVDSFVKWDEKTYQKKINRYEQIIDSNCEIPVYIMEFDEFYVYFLKNQISYNVAYVLSGSNRSLMGLCVSNTVSDKWPKEFIFINKKLSPESIISTFFHENQHYKCKKNKCECISARSLWATEAHAIESELKESIRYNLPDVLINSVNDLLSYSRSSILYYRIAAQNVMSSEVYSDALIKIKEYNDDRLKKTKEN